MRLYVLRATVANAGEQGTKAKAESVICKTYAPYTLHDPEACRRADRRRVFNFVAAAARRQTRAHDVHTDHAGARGGMQYIAGPKDGRAHEA